MSTTPCKRCNGTGDEPDQKTIGASMRSKRYAYGKSLRQVAIKMGKSAPYISDLELGRRQWNAGLIADFEKALK